MERYGFTPYAREKLLYPRDVIKDAKPRVYTLGGKDADGKRVRRQTRTVLTLAFKEYLSDDVYTHLWVSGKDGKRHLVHRKRCFTNDHRPFEVESTLDAVMASGHYRRFGHKLVGYYLNDPNEPGIVRMIRTCCDEVE